MLGRKVQSSMRQKASLIKAITRLEEVLQQLMAKFEEAVSKIKRGDLNFYY
jgi:hypothetical protein